MKILLLLSSFLISAITLNAQNPDGFEAACKKHISGTIPLAYTTQLYGKINSPNTRVLDAREIKEYEVSHIPKAIFVGFDKFDKNSVSSISKSDTIFIYCSIGYRSEKIGEKLQKMGYNNVFNLYGGIFNWVNSGYKVVDKNNKETKNVHGYDKEWSKLLNEKRCSVTIED